MIEAFRNLYLNIDRTIGRPTHFCLIFCDKNDKNVTKTFPLGGGANWQVDSSLSLLDCRYMGRFGSQGVSLSLP
jgi:hypothetical protein